MATSGSIADAFSGRPNYDLLLNVTRAAVVGNTSSWAWALYTRQLSGADAWASDPQPWSGNVEGTALSGSTGMDFRGSVATILMGSGTTGFKAHDANGYLTLDFSATVGAESPFGTASASGSIVVDRIPKVPGTPAVPTLIGSATSSAFSVSLAPPSDNGGTPILDYYTEVATDAAFTAVVQSRTSSASSQSFTGLNPATPYYTRYRARNAQGNSAYSPTRTTTTAVAVPSAPLSPAVSDTGPTSGLLEWLAPASNGGGTITAYKVTRALDVAFTQGVVQFTQGATLSKAFTDLLPSTSYSFKIEAANSAGYGPASAVVTITTVSGAYYSNGSAWLPAGVFRSDGANWVPAELLVSDGAVYIEAI